MPRDSRLTELPLAVAKASRSECPLTLRALEDRLVVENE